MASGSPAQSRVVVIGAGVMGSGIAAHMANLGWQVSVLDVPPSDPSSDRLDVVRAAWERAKKARPPHFYLPGTADTVRLGNTEDHLDWVREADWVVEAVVEKMDIKRRLYEKLEPLLRDDTSITTNTSGLSIRELAEGRSDAFRRRFLGTHFFNPPRYLKLLEIIPTPETDPEVIRRVTLDAEDLWGKRVVPARDTPGFIANRIGMFGMVQAIHATLACGLSIEEADALTGPIIGRPKSASFRLNDIVGLDIMADVAGNQYNRLTEDIYRDTLQLPSVVKQLIEKGRLGNKTGQGFYKREGKEFLSLDLETLEYRPMQKAEIEGLDAIARMPWMDKLNELLHRQDSAGKFMRSHLMSTLVYALYVTPEVSDTIHGVDRVMRWGFGWEKGPFELVDAMGVKPFLDFLGAEGFDAPKIVCELHDSRTHNFYAQRPGQTSYFLIGTPEMAPMPEEPKCVTVTQLKETRKPQASNEDATLWDTGQRVLLVEFHTKMNALCPGIVEMVIEGLDRAERNGYGLVLANDGRAFSAGFNLALFLRAAEKEDWQAIDGYIAGLQEMGRRLRRAKVSTVSAIHGYTLGGGCEAAIHCNVVVADPESVIGLPECNVGVIPAAGGTTTMTQRNPGLEERFLAWQILRSATLSANADDARRLGFLGESDRTSYNPDHRLWAAIELARGPVVTRGLGAVPGLGRSFLDKVDAFLDSEPDLTDFDRVLGRLLAGAMSSESEDLTEDEMHEKERHAFLEAIKHRESQERVKVMLETGKPLKN